MARIITDRHKYREFTYEKILDVERNTTFGYLYIGFKQIPETIRMYFFENAKPVDFGNKERWITPIPHVIKGFASDTRISINGAEWRKLVGSPDEHSYLVIWWDYSHYGWSGPTVEFDAERFIDAMIRHINYYDVYKINCHHCGKEIPELEAHNPDFGAWGNTLCKDCLPIVEGYKRKADDNV